ncbi:MAG: hypothetical protein AAFO58_06890 [Pseudomonadota bacterium]
MCISSAALAAFLTVIGAEHVSLGDDRVIVNAEVRGAQWVANEDDMWCTMAPQIDRQERFTQLVSE